jgi:hypothetical protein
MSKLPYKKSKADFWMYGKCPVCGNALKNHSFDEYNHCKNSYMQLDEPALAENLN